MLWPLVRFEAVAPLLLDVGLLLAFRKFPHAVAVIFIGIVGVGGFGLYLRSLGLPWLPSSVLIKSQVASAGVNISDGVPAGFLVTLVRNLANNLDAA